jgi:hypothetical protein
MRKGQYQLRPRGLVRIVAGKATGGLDGLPLMSPDQLGILYIMTVHAQSRAVLLQLEIEFPLASFTSFMDGVAGLTTHIQSGMAAAPLFDANTYFVARQAEILVLPSARNRFHQMVLVIRRMRIVALQAIADGREMDTSLDFIGIFIAMALDTKLDWGYGFEINARNIIVFTDLVTTQTSVCDRRMDGLPLLFILMTLQTLTPIDILLKGDRVFPSPGERENSDEGQKYHYELLQHQTYSKTIRLRDPDSH